MASEHVRRRMIFTGTVQGVGFRATTCRLAEDFAVTGFVRNLRDGTVELEVQGAPSEIEGLRGAIQREMGDLIRDLQQTEQPTLGDEAGFHIRR